MTNSELTIIRQAIIKEIEGYEFYKMVAERENNTKETKEAFLELAEEEFQHVRWLENMYSLVKSDKSENFEMANELDVPAPSNLKWKKIDKNSGSIAVAVFGIGIQMERASIEYYTKAANETKIESAKKFFMKLAKWEQAHLELLSKEYDELLGEWWSEQGYAPF
ncbi:MAG: ferritin family protein [Solirubrobacterales bacterium]